MVLTKFPGISRELASTLSKIWKWSISSGKLRLNHASGKRYEKRKQWSPVVNRPVFDSATFARIKLFAQKLIYCYSISKWEVCCWRSAVSPFNSWRIGNSLKCFHELCQILIKFSIPSMSVTQRFETAQQVMRMPGGLCKVSRSCPSWLQNLNHDNGRLQFDST